MRKKNGRNEKVQESHQNEMVCRRGREGKKMGLWVLG